MRLALLRLAQRLRSRLALRIYLAGLAQFAAVVLGFILVVRALAPEGPPGPREARFAVEGVVARVGNGEGEGDGAALTRELVRVRDTLGATIEIQDDAGRVLAKTPTEAEAPRSPPPPGSGPPPGGPGSGPPRGPGFGPPRPRPGDSVREQVFSVRLPDGRAGRAVYTFRDRGPPGPPGRDIAVIIALVLVVVGVASWLTARSIGRPLARLSRAARAFGAGQLDARVALARSDEIGEVAAAFDEMADRVTDLLRAEKELLANVSHELRTPLARIRVALDIAAEGDAEVARQSLGEIAEDLAELERLISDVLTAARLDLVSGSRAGSGIPPLRRERVDVRELLDRAAAKLRSAHPTRPLVVEVAPDLPAIEGDPVLLRRVVDNLLENAHKYSSRPDDPVELRAQVEGGEGGEGGAIHIEVRDRGVGIAPEDLPHIFRPFFRADRSRTRATGGLGLGLALARRIVAAHHGTIVLESDLDEGTRAHVRLPVTPAQAPSGGR